MALHSSGGALHQAPGMLGPVFVVPVTATYWADMEVSGPGTVSLVDVVTGATIAVGPGSVQLAAGRQVQFQAINTTAATKAAGGRIIPYAGPGGER